MNYMTHLTLGRVSNLPTVWTNVLAASAVTGATLGLSSCLLLLVAMTLFYIAGMYYNDACDADYDSQHQQHRPIPSGHISRDRVEAYALGYATIGLLLVYSARMSAPDAQGSGSAGWLVSVAMLLGFIIIYNRHHKQNPLSPLLMAGARACVLLTTSYALTASLSPILFAAMLCTLSWIIGLTYFAKHEHSIDSPRTLLDYWPLALMSIPVFMGTALGVSSSASALVPAALLIPVIVTAHARVTKGTGAEKGQAIGLMIAGICLVDGVFLSMVWGLSGAVTCIVGFGLTLALQKWVAGT